MLKVILLLLVSVSLFKENESISDVYVDCNGKGFHCKNSTSFLICVDVGNGVTQTVDDLIQHCPLETYCSNNAPYECMDNKSVSVEYNSPTTMSDGVYNKETQPNSEKLIPVTTLNYLANKDTSGDSMTNSPIENDLLLAIKNGYVNPINGINSLPIEEHMENNSPRFVNDNNSPLLTTFMSESNEPLKNIHSSDDSSTTLFAESKPSGNLYTPAINILDTNFPGMHNTVSNIPQNIKTLNYHSSSMSPQGMSPGIVETYPNVHEQSMIYGGTDGTYSSNEGNRLPNSIDSLTSFENSNNFPQSVNNLDNSYAVSSSPINIEEPITSTNDKTTHYDVHVQNPQEMIPNHSNQNTISNRNNVISTLSGIPYQNSDSQHSDYIPPTVHNSTQLMPSSNNIADTQFISPTTNMDNMGGGIPYIPPIYVGTTNSGNYENGSTSNYSINQNVGSLPQNTITVRENETKTLFSDGFVDFQPVSFVPRDSQPININPKEEIVRQGAFVTEISEPNTMAKNNPSLTEPTQSDELYGNSKLNEPQHFLTNQRNPDTLNNLSDNVVPISMNSDFVFPKIVDDEHIFNYENMNRDVYTTTQTVPGNYEYNQNNLVPNTSNNLNTPVVSIYGGKSDTTDSIRPLYRANNPLNNNANNPVNNNENIPNKPNWNNNDEENNMSRDSVRPTGLLPGTQEQRHEEPSIIHSQHLNNGLGVVYSSNDNPKPVVVITPNIMNKYDETLPKNDSTVENKVLPTVDGSPVYRNQQIPLNDDLNRYQGYGYSLNQGPENVSSVTNPEQRDPGSTECVEYGPIPDVTTCHSYFVCRDNQQHRLFCPYNMIYSPILKICTTDKDHCVRTNTEFKCTTSGMHPDPTSCYSYYECQLSLNGFQVNKYFCPWYSSYNPQYKQCVEGDSVYCHTFTYRTPYYPNVHSNINPNDQTQPTRVVQHVQDNIQQTITRPYEDTHNPNIQLTQGQSGTSWTPSRMYWS